MAMNLDKMLELRFLREESFLAGFDRKFLTNPPTITSIAKKPKKKLKKRRERKLKGGI